MEYISMENQWFHCYNLHEVIWFSSIPVLKCYRFPIWHPEKFSLLSLISTGCPKVFMSHSFICKNKLNFIDLSKCDVISFLINYWFHKIFDNLPYAWICSCRSLCSSAVFMLAKCIPWKRQYCSDLYQFALKEME